MKIVILNGNPIIENRMFNDYLCGLKDTLERVGHEVQLFTLSTLTINQCIGCWSCWVRTPGKCLFKDGMEPIYSAIMMCDLLIMASPLRMGFISGLLKRAIDRMIPLLTPYFSIIDGEFHHRKRYTKYPKLGLITEKETDTDPEDIRILRQIFDRLAINFHSQIKFLHFIDSSEKELVHAINHL
ncbi:MAG: flavodoxin family protein [Candidatus Marinimicrobia bacterium]|nr:flavodoxin family protein [Candidatus Neomarinimicrobiota bacterium]